jgi:hypothetical protein
MNRRPILSIRLIHYLVIPNSKECIALKSLVISTLLSDRQERSSMPTIHRSKAIDIWHVTGRVIIIIGLFVVYYYCGLGFGLGLPYEARPIADNTQAIFIG